MATTEASSLLASMEVRDEWQDDDFPRWGSQIIRVLKTPLHMGNPEYIWKAYYVIIELLYVSNFIFQKLMHR